MPKRVKGVPTTIKRKIKFLWIENGELRAFNKMGQMLLRNSFHSEIGVDLTKMFNGKAFIKVSKDLIIKSR